MRARRPSGSVWLAALGLASSPSLGANCRPASGYSPCIDANALWPSPGEQRFFSIATPSERAPGRVSFGFQGQALFQPLALDVPGPTAGAREVELVDHALDATWLFDAGLGYGLSLGAVFGAVLAQSGAGIEGITSQRGALLERTVARDPRVRVAYTYAPVPELALEPRLELSLPLGEADAFAGAGAPTFTPGLALMAAVSRFHFGVDAGFRLRRAVELGTGRYGSQLALAAGASFDVLDHARLFVACESFALFPLIDSTSSRGRALEFESTWIPAEWLLSVGTRPFSDSRFSIVLGAGSGLALATDEVGGEKHRYFAPTSPLFRTLLALRFSSKAAPPSLPEPGRNPPE